MDGDLVGALRFRGVTVITALHAGMIFAPQQRFPVGEQLRRLPHLRATATIASMRNRVEFLSNWG